MLTDGVRLRAGLAHLKYGFRTFRQHGEQQRCRETLALDVYSNSINSPLNLQQ